MFGMMKIVECGFIRVQDLMMNGILTDSFKPMIQVDLQARGVQKVNWQCFMKKN
jgi:hypothetical protein